MTIMDIVMALGGGDSQLRGQKGLPQKSILQSLIASVAIAAAAAASIAIAATAIARNRCKCH